MHILRGLSEPDTARCSVVSIGNFDGVHRGHRSMIAALIRRARELGVPAVVFTFDPHPIALLRPAHTPPPLSTTARKLELLERCGVDCVVVYPTDRALLDLSPREFFDRIVLGQLAAQGLVEGPNFYFGHDRAGDVATLAGFCAAVGLSLDIVPPLKIGGLIVSSSEIRRLVQAGDVRRAGDLLGEPYRLRGSVGRGAERGRALGFPTANLDQVQVVLPRDGVYAGRVSIVERNTGQMRDACRHYPAAVNIGPNPTFAEHARKVEVHLIDFSGNLYGCDLDVDFLDRLRDTTAFAGPDALKTQLVRDVADARRIASR
jgi:riboflavin kinase/FMN adenylyltransferase